MAFDDYEENYRSGMEDDLAEPTPGASGSSSPAQDEYRIEPELLQPTPRNIRVRSVTKFGRYMWMAVAIGIPVALSQFGNASQAKFEALKDHGKDTEAVLSSTRPRKTGKHGHAPSGTFHYSVGGGSYTISIDFTDDEYARARRGDRRTVVYLPERPDVARMKDELTRNTYASEAMGLWIVGGVGGVILVGIWIWAERRRSRRTHLASEGVAVATTSFDMRKASSKKNDNNWKVSYTYMFDGQLHEGSATFSLPAIQKMLVGGTTTTVLVDPAQPKRHELYASVKDSIDVLPATSGFGDMT